jgi:hypothetical protein
MNREAIGAVINDFAADRSDYSSALTDLKSTPSDRSFR